MDDISSSLKRLQDSIRGLSDASALVGDDGSPGGGDQIANLNFGDGIFDETSPICTRARTSASSSSLSDGVRGRSYCHAQKPVSYKCAPATSSSMRKIDASSGEQRFEDGDGGLSMRRSGSPGSHIFDHHSREDANAHDSAEKRAAREVEDLRQEKESLRLMKRQLAAVHELRSDLERKDAVIETLRMKLREAGVDRDRAEELKASCRLLEQRCSRLESSNAEYAEKIGALDQQSRTRIDGLLRDVDKLSARAQDAEAELKAERKRFHEMSMCHDRELGTALAEGAEARELARGLEASLKEASAQAKRRHERASEMTDLLTDLILARGRERSEKSIPSAASSNRSGATSSPTLSQLTSQLHETRASLGRAERRASAAAEARRRDTEAAVNAASALAGHVQALIGGGDGGGEQAGSPTERFVTLSSRWCGNEVLALTWVEVSKVVEALEGAKVAERAALESAGSLKRKLVIQRQEKECIEHDVESLRTEKERLRMMETQLATVTARLEAARWDETYLLFSQDGLLDTVRTRLSHLGLVPSASSASRVTCAGRDGRNADGTVGSDHDPAQTRFPIFASSEEELTSAMERLAAEFLERGKTIEALSLQARDEEVRRNEEKARLETLVGAAREEAGAHAEQLARLVRDFEGKAASAEAGLSERMRKAVAEATAVADRQVAATAAEASRKTSAASSEADRRVTAATEALARAEDERAAALEEVRRATEGRLASEAALKLLGRFVGPLHRLCLELREQKRFLSRNYRRTDPLQMELFAVAAAVNGKDYWCLSACTGDPDGGQQSLEGDTRSSSRGGSRSPGGDIRASFSHGDFSPPRKMPSRQGDTAVTRNSNGQQRGHGDVVEAPQEDILPVSPPDVPPSLRAVVIAVIAANRIARPLKARGRGGGRGDRNEGKVDTRYMSGAGGMRQLPVLPPWCAARELQGLPGVEELESMPDARALEVILGTILSTASDGDHRLAGRVERGVRRSAGVGISVSANPAETVVPSGSFANDVGGGGGSVLDLEAFRGRVGDRGGLGSGDLVHGLVRGRKDHMAKVKAFRWCSPHTGEAQASPSRHLFRPVPALLSSRRRIPPENTRTPTGAPRLRNCCVPMSRSGGSPWGPAPRRRNPSSGDLDMAEESQPAPESRDTWTRSTGTCQRDIRKALAALARELNASEAVRLKAEEALREAGGRAGIRESIQNVVGHDAYHAPILAASVVARATKQLEHTAEALRYRVGQLEAEASARPDESALLAVEDEKRRAVETAERFRQQVLNLEEEVSKARAEVSEAMAEVASSLTERDEIQRRLERSEAGRAELLGEVEQLKAFAHRVNTEREECLERERASASSGRGLGHPGDGARGPKGGRFRTNGADAVVGDIGEQMQTPGSEFRPSPVGNSRGQRPLPTGREGPLAEVGRKEGKEEEELSKQERRLSHCEDQLARCRRDEARARHRCESLEARLVEARGDLEKQKVLTGSMRREAAKSHKELETVRITAEETSARFSKREAEARREIAVLEARLDAVGARESRRRDLLQLQASAYEDLQQALSDALPTPSDLVGGRPSPEPGDGNDGGV